MESKEKVEKVVKEKKEIAMLSIPDWNKADIKTDWKAKDYHIEGFALTLGEPETVTTKKGERFITKFTLIDEEGQTALATLWGTRPEYVNCGGAVELRGCTVMEFQGERRVNGYTQRNLPPDAFLTAFMGNAKPKITGRENYWQERYNFDVQNAGEIARMHIENNKLKAYEIAAGIINTQVAQGIFVPTEDRSEIFGAVQMMADEIVNAIGEEKSDEKIT